MSSFECIAKYALVLSLSINKIAVIETNQTSHQ
jgi:hypothetical protein